ncbi:alpha-1,3-mannosyl-glycoprotein 2-beta-N-acetylglucosaminyltransferase [Galendromus occidentalis]|uniref:Alpha-1,3-mannosyl-glycoprotein 2-beta-N-acetylglucosaminyltransferase n=1 Tax=Galendromus occidentalis TaxID=34638 RepID=A0AAJ6VU53_9ACAR|nr:alpha-1,3-mannosyl-glycoprotein 2-beta-N-acetylglucosaminyltransferase [Galendromus occidentalis]
MRRRNPLLLLLSVASLGWIALTYHLLKSPDNEIAASYFRQGIQTKLDALEVGLRNQKNDARGLYAVVDGIRQTKQLNGSRAFREQRLRASKGRPVIPILLFACNRVTVKKPIEQLLNYRPNAENFPIIVSADCNHQLTLKTIKVYGDQVQLIQQPDQSDYKLPLKQKKFKGYYKIARHYGWALNKTFLDLNYNSVIIVEDDLEIAPDFFSYFESLLPILEADPSLYCVSAWNDNGKAGLIQTDNSSLLYRSDFFPGLGWMMTRDLWLELMTKWPKAFWDDWIREPEQRRNRACIRPEISRTKTFGKIGVSNGLFYEKHLKFIELSREPVDFLSKDLSYLLRDNYDVDFVKEVYGSPAVALTTVTNGKVNLPIWRPVRVTYTNISSFKHIAKLLSIMDDFKSGVPRTGYRGVVSCMHKGRRVYVAPPADWKGYDPKWS